MVKKCPWRQEPRVGASLQSLLSGASPRGLYTCTGDRIAEREHLMFAISRDGTKKKAIKVTLSGPFE